MQVFFIRKNEPLFYVSGGYVYDQNHHRDNTTLGRSIAIDNFKNFHRVDRYTRRLMAKRKGRIDDFLAKELYWLYTNTPKKFYDDQDIEKILEEINPERVSKKYHHLIITAFAETCGKMKLQFSEKIYSKFYDIFAHLNYDEYELILRNFLYGVFGGYCEEFYEEKEIHSMMYFLLEFLTLEDVKRYKKESFVYWSGNRCLKTVDMMIDILTAKEEKDMLLNSIKNKSLNKTKRRM